ncbi:cleft lip and palate transmembrane protein 1 [Salvia divinorum]|uniref:Cleft lip and palate transmembrane protein 1 n=1 Tax=Salvia divinorum TaxID=28513 RepID=A0ABD1IMC9_SALDI
MEPPAVQEAAGVRRQQPQQQAGVGQMLTGVIRIAVFWYFASKFFGPKRSPTQSSTQISNLFHKGELLDMWLYVSEHEKFSDFGSEAALVWQETNIPYAAWTPDSTRTLSLKYQPTEALKSNGSLYAHVFFAKSGYPPDPQDPEYQPLAAFGRTHSIVVYLPKSKSDRRKSLLGNSEDSSDDGKISEVAKDVPEDEKEDEPAEWKSYWKPNITINLVDDFTRYQENAVPPNIAPYMNIEPTTGNYYPTVFFNEFWLLRDKLIQLNETANELPLNLEVAPISMTKWQLFLQIDQSFQVHRSYGSMLEGEADELKRVFLEGNPILLAVTMVVSALHSIFDFLAFKNDIQFWNKNKSMEGLSAKSVVVNFFCQLIVFLYLLDNETSWMILASSGIGCCIEFWKIGKAMHIEVDRTGTIPMLRFRDRDSYATNKTKEYDDLAMKYLTYVLLFLAVCFSIYSLKYERHKSWYSWILSSLTSCVYMFGFIMMCPQLFINYKLKSVAHLPWRQMTYKFLNTIIDDLFAFVIKMPILHRLSVFRDDVIFLIYLYQRWKYPVDKKRVNEFGFGGEDEQALAATTDSTQQTEEDKKTN